MLLKIQYKKPLLSSNANKSLFQRYLSFCDREMKVRTLWYLIPLISLTAVIMPIGIFSMSYFSGYLPFVGLSMLLFFGNIIVNIADYNTRITVSFYLLTIVIHVLVPLLSLILQS